MATTNSIEQHTLDLESQRFQLEREKFEAEQNNKKRNWWTSPLLLSVAAGVVGLVGNAAALYVNWAEQNANAAQQIELEKRREDHEHQLAHEKQQGDLVLEAIKTGNSGLARENLLLLAQTRLLDDPTQGNH